MTFALDQEEWHIATCSIQEHGNKAEVQHKNKTGQRPPIDGQRYQLWSENDDDMLIQDPRFAGVRIGRHIVIKCGCRGFLPKNANITWYQGNEDGTVISYVSDTDPTVKMQENLLTIEKVQPKHSGYYFCNFTTKGVRRVPCGTELVVLGSGNRTTALSRNTAKDAIILIQTVLIVLFITVPAMLLMEMKKKRSLKIEDHTYEGLEAYQTATYEDIQTVRVLAAKTMEGEHPCVE
ncbi:B-cell antigen receptor complex-associated protein beta chain [Gastrophryne carolinensis]